MQATRLVFLGLLTTSLAACGDDDEEADAPVLLDAGPDAPSCLAPASFGAINEGQPIGGTATLSLETIDGETHNLIRFSVTTQETPPDGVQIELWEGYGAFENGYAAGSFDITGPEANILECGACVIVFADLVGSTAAQLYMAQGGTITIDAIQAQDGATLTGSVSNVTFAQIDQMTGEVIPGGCTTAVEAMAWSVTLEQAM